MAVEVGITVTDREGTPATVGIIERIVDCYREGLRLPSPLRLEKWTRDRYGEERLVNISVDLLNRSFTVFGLAQSLERDLDRAVLKEEACVVGEKLLRSMFAELFQFQMLNLCYNQGFAC